MDQGMAEMPRWFPWKYASPFHCAPYRVRLFGWHMYWDLADGILSVRIFRKSRT